MLHHDHQQTDIEWKTQAHESLLVILLKPLTYIYHMFVKFITLHKFYCLFGGESWKNCRKWTRTANEAPNKFNDQSVNLAISGQRKSNESMNVSTLSYVHALPCATFKQTWKVHLTYLRAGAPLLQWYGSPNVLSFQLPTFNSHLYRKIIMQSPFYGPFPVSQWRIMNFRFKVSMYYHKIEKSIKMSQF